MTEFLDGFFGRIFWTDFLDGFFGRISLMDFLDGCFGRIFSTYFFDGFFEEFFRRTFLKNFNFSEDFLTYNLLIVASFRIGVPSILFNFKTREFKLLLNANFKFWQIRPTQLPYCFASKGGKFGGQ